MLPPVQNLVSPTLSHEFDLSQESDLVQRRELVEQSPQAVAAGTSAKPEITGGQPEWQSERGCECG